MPVLKSNLHSKLVTVSKLESNENPEVIIMFTSEHRACDSEQNDSTHSHLSSWECNNGRSFYFAFLAAEAAEVIVLRTGKFVRSKIGKNSIAFPPFQKNNLTGKPLYKK